MEVQLMIPANSILSLTWEFDKSILRYTEYPPDANRGFDVP
jgi:phosphatidylinositol glycan class T